VSLAGGKTPAFNDFLLDAAADLSSVAPRTLKLALNIHAQMLLMGSEDRRRILTPAVPPAMVKVQR
jgi:hypothetical protein